MNLLQKFNHDQVQELVASNPVPDFRPGDTVRVNVKVKEGSRERVQAYQGVCIARRNNGLHSSFTVRRMMADEGIERVFPLYSPLISIERVRQGVVRRAKLYYLRNRRGKSARIAEKMYYQQEGNAAVQESASAEA